MISRRDWSSNSGTKRPRWGNSATVSAVAISSSHRSRRATEDRRRSGGRFLANPPGPSRSRLFFQPFAEIGLDLSRGVNATRPHVGPSLFDPGQQAHPFGEEFPVGILRQAAHLSHNLSDGLFFARHGGNESRVARPRKPSLPLQLCAEAAEVFDETRVGAFDDFGVAHDGAAGDRGGDHRQRHGGADDIRRIDNGRAERAVAENDDAMRVADHRVGSELRELGNPRKPFS